MYCRFGLFLEIIYQFKIADHVACPSTHASKLMKLGYIVWVYPCMVSRSKMADGEYISSLNLF